MLYNMSKHLVVSKLKPNFVEQTNQSVIMEVLGKLTHKFEAETLETKSGPKQKMMFVIQQPGKYPDPLALETMNTQVITFLADTKIGSELKCLVNIKSREYNGKWYTNAMCGQVEICKSQDGGSKEVPIDQNPPTMNSYSQDPDSLPF